MSTLAALKLSSTKRSTQLSPIEHRRNKLATKIGEQILLAQAQQAGETYTQKRYKIQRNEDGSSRTVEVAKRVRQWWWAADGGRVCVNIRYGSRVLELAKGKSTIEVANAGELINTLSLVQSAVTAGELDAQIEAASGAVRKGFRG
jgi:hypothetical protein